MIKTVQAAEADRPINTSTSTSTRGSHENLMMDLAEDWLGAVAGVDTLIQETQCLVVTHMARIEQLLSPQVPIQAGQPGRGLVGLVTHRDRAHHLVTGAPPPAPPGSCPTCVRGQVGQIIAIGPPVTQPYEINVV